MNSVPIASERLRAQEWPHGSLDLAALVQSGWQPVPFRQFVLKVHSRCNLSCGYCYVYHQADQSWRRQPAAMSREIVTATALRIAEHARSHRLPSVQVILHGGEPLLGGRELLDFVAATVQEALPRETQLSFTLQTNAVLLDERFLKLFLDRGIKVGVSIDGGSEQQNRRRVFGNGTTSLGGTLDGVKLLASDRFRPVFAGLLCVVDLASDPVEVYESLLEWKAPAIDFLLPHGNWSARPPGRQADEQVTPYADWLVRLFDRWYSATEHETDLRFFREIISLLLGGRSQVETVGLTPSTVVVVETDGSIEQVDALKSAYHGAASTGLGVEHHSFDAAFRHPGLLARQIGTSALGDECMPCRVRDVCGGGFYPHRYRRGSGFRNRSVYCPDLFALVMYIGARLRTDLEFARRRAG